MSKDNKFSASEHGNMISYIIGFILSLIFTFIPYYLVVNQILVGSTLLMSIFGFAVIQMIVQVTFFLHLGRGPKPNWNLFFFVATVGVIIMVVGGSILIINNLHYNMAPSEQTKKLLRDEGIYQIGGEKTGICTGKHSNYQVEIIGNRVNPELTIASKCDTLSFINNSEKEIEITFGEHPSHEVYAGDEKILVRKGRTKTITLSEPGTFNFHDHLYPETAGTFTVTNF